MTAQFVSARGDLAHQGRETFCHPTQDEERGMDVESRKRFQKAASVCLHTAGITIPMGAVHDIGKRFGVKIVLHVHRHYTAGHFFWHSPNGLAAEGPCPVSLSSFPFGKDFS